MLFRQMSFRRALHDFDDAAFLLSRYYATPSPLSLFLRLDISFFRPLLCFTPFFFLIISFATRFAIDAILIFAIELPFHATIIAASDLLIIFRPLPYRPSDVITPDTSATTTPRPFCSPFSLCLIYAAAFDELPMPYAAAAPLPLR